MMFSKVVTMSMHGHAIQTSKPLETFKPSTMPGPRKDFADVRLALSKLDLKTSGKPNLQDNI